MDSCLGGYKQLFGQGQHFTYDMFDLAEYYKQYHAVMTHWHTVLPGKVLDVHYEETVMDLECQVRRILAHCGLPFEEQCLRYYETDRAVKTASSEQVRQPIYRVRSANGAATKSTWVRGLKISMPSSRICPRRSGTPGGNRHAAGRCAAVGCRNCGSPRYS